MEQYPQETMINPLNDDTICAIATAQGGAIGIIRISGPQAIAITGKIFTPARSGISLDSRQPYTLTFGTIKDDDEIVDEVLVSLFRGPKSYTGEDTTEITCHGSQYILNRVVQLLIDSGCRLAQPGEYTQRAYLNGKMDLSQAEAVADLIASTSAATHRLAISQMRGGFSQELGRLRDRLLHLTSLMELELDFADHEELEFADRGELRQIATEIEQKLSRLVDSFRTGNALKNGIPVAIIGETNAGKSTLLNALLNEEKAIVSDIHGTTRDVIEDTITLGGTLFRFIDTAGIRESADTIERIGIERTFEQIRKADIVLWVLDATNAEEQYASLAPRILPLIEERGTKLVLVVNKCDLNPDTTFGNSLSLLKETTATQSQQLEEALKTMPSIAISAKSRQNLDSLIEALSTINSEANEADIIVTNARHYEALTHALEAIARVQDGLTASLPGDLISQDLRECLFHLAEITGGAITTDEVLSNIFSHFCIGK